MRLAAAGFAIMAFGAPALAQTVPPQPASPPLPIHGTWVTELETEVTIAPCDVGQCGYLSKIVIPEKYAASADAVAAVGVENLVDVNNKDPALRNRPLLGLRLLSLPKTVSPSVFEGEIYNPEDGNMYFGRIELIDAQTMRLTGCALVVLCQSQDWTRAPDLPPGNAEAPPAMAAAAPPPAPPPEDKPLDLF